ncbi:MAG: hypothetical protein AAFV19_18215 [Pseudomonadota bacterium]
MATTSYKVRTIGSSVIAYCVTVGVIFGGLFKPSFLLLTSPSYLLFFPEMIVGGAIGFVLVFLLTRFGHPGGFRWPAIVAATIIGGVVVAWISQSVQRGIVIEVFAPDRLETHSFLWSLRNVPAEPQIDLHAVAMKDCVPYGWGYRKRAFYEIPHNAAINVVPPGWLEECGIERKPR